VCESGLFSRNVSGQDASDCEDEIWPERSMGICNLYDVGNLRSYQEQEPSVPGNSRLFRYEESDRGGCEGMVQ
jgi:hypothetical protein